MAVYRVGLKTKPHLKNSVLRIFHNGSNGLAGVSFLALGDVCKLPQAVLQGVDGICDASLASRDCTLSTGEHKRVRSRMNSSKRFTVRYIGLLPLLA